MIIKIRKSDFANLILYISEMLLGLNYILYNMLGISMLKDILRVIAILLMLFYWTIKERKFITYVQIMALLIAIIPVAIHGKSCLNLLALFLIGLCMGDNDENIKITLHTGICMSGIIGVLLLSGLVGNTMWKGSALVVRKVRWTLGFSNPNHAAAFITSILLMVLMIGSVTYKKIILSFIIEIVTFYFTDSRTWFWAFVFFTLAILGIERINNLKKLYMFFSIFINGVFFLHLIMNAIVENLQRFDLFLSYRIRIIKNIIVGTNVENVLLGRGELNVDNIYIDLLYGYGIYVYIFAWIIICLAYKNLKKYNMKKEICFLVTILAVGIMESSPLRPEILSSIIFWNIMFSSLNNCRQKDTSVCYT